MTATDYAQPPGFTETSVSLSGSYGTGNPIHAKNIGVHYTHGQSSKAPSFSAMSSNPSKDWIEKEIAGLDNKIKVKEADAATRFEKALGEFNAKFERMTADSNAKFAQIETNIARSETNSTRWFIGFVIATVGFSTAIILKNTPGMSDMMRVEARFTEIDKKFVAVDHRFEAVESRLGTVESRLGTVENQLTDVKTQVTEINQNLKQLIHKK